MYLKPSKITRIPIYIVVVFITLAFIILEVILKDWFLARNESELLRVIESTAESIKRINASNDDMPLVAESTGLVATHYQITIADKTGQVLGDFFLLGSYQTVPDNIFQTPEFNTALKQGLGKNIRMTPSGIELFYLAKRIEHGEQVLIIRVAMNTQDFHTAVISLRMFLAAMVIALFVFIGVFMYAYLTFLNQSIAKERELLESRVEERTQDILLLQRLSSMLAACQHPSEIQKVVYDMLPRIIGDFPCAISLFNEKDNIMETILHWGGEWQGELEFNTEHCWALRKGSYHLSKDALSQQQCQHMHGCEESTLCIPLLGNGRTIGVFHLVVGESFSQEAIQITCTLAEHIGLTLANLILQETLRNQAMKDPLTGLYNRRYLEESLALEASRSVRQQGCFTLLMVDIDNFKQFNDKFGHDAGDYVLTFLSTLLINTLRKEDIVCRVGGEEMAIILPESNAEQGQLCAEKLRQLVASQALNYQEQSLGNVTISIGISVFPLHTNNHQELIKIADIELYKVKNNGRNGVSIKPQ